MSPRVPLEGVFNVGDKVHKPEGYVYPGVVVSRFETLSGGVRYVVEHYLSRGMLHIFSGTQLAPGLARDHGDA